jgi:hypothetical protein
MEPKYLKSLGNQGFQHYTGLRALPQMRGYPIWLDPRSDRHRAAGLQYFPCRGLQSAVTNWLGVSATSGTNKSGVAPSRSSPVGTAIMRASGREFLCLMIEACLGQVASGL